MKEGRDFKAVLNPPVYRSNLEDSPHVADLKLTGVLPPDAPRKHIFHQWQVPSAKADIFFSGHPEILPLGTVDNREHFNSILVFHFRNSIPGRSDHVREFFPSLR